jgi:signal transduction histidine kinase/CheY-like chemotaxis protein
MKVYAGKNNSVTYFSDPENLLEDSIAALSKTLSLEAKLNGFNRYISVTDNDRKADPVAEFGIQEAELLLNEGFPLDAFLDMLKCYKQACIDLIGQSGVSPDKSENFKIFTTHCFERIEKVCADSLNRLIETKGGRKAKFTNCDKSDERSYYQTIFEKIPTPVYIVDHQGIVLDFNHAAFTMFPEIHRLTRIGGLLTYTKSNNGNFEKQFEGFVAGSSSVSSFEIYIDTSDCPSYFRIRLTRLPNSEGISDEIVVMLEDITKYQISNKKLESARQQAEEADQLKSSFLANMSHEIRTPMNAILGFTELMINGKYNEKEHAEYLELIKRSSNDLLNIIEDIIDIAKMEAKQLKIKYKVCKPHAIFTELIPVFKETLRRYGIDDTVRFTLNIADEDSDLIMYTDGERLKQVMSNLLSNAAKFTSEGFIEYGYRSVNDSHIYFFVRDSGSGIPESKFESIFERFVQLEGNSTMNSGGAGLGLAICKNIVDLLGGKIWVESQPGKGSTFYFRLPRHEVPRELQTENLAYKERFPRDSNEWEGKKILIAEDDEINYVFISELLKRTGAEIIRASNGLEAINLTESTEDIDLILMDIKMPEINGLEATQYIATIRPALPIIALTAYAMNGDKQKCLNAGCRDYLVKPVLKEELFATLEKFLPAIKIRGGGSRSVKVK